MSRTPLLLAPDRIRSIYSTRLVIRQYTSSDAPTQIMPHWPNEEEEEGERGQRGRRGFKVLQPLV